MDETHDQSPNLKSLKHFMRCHQNTTKFLLSVSVFFSIFFSNSTFHSNFSSLLVKLITHTIDKNFMFLFCNGLLVLLAKYSSLTTTTTNSPSKQNVSNDEYYFFKRSYEEDVPQMRSQISSVQREDDVSVKEVEPEEKRVLEPDQVQPEKIVQEDRTEEEEEQEEAKVTLYETLTAAAAAAAAEEEEEEEEEVFGEEEEEKEVSGALLSTEELNKKFDEFIRKMKEELRIEARQHQLIMV